MQVLVTRPAREAQLWVAWLRGRGLNAQPLPLMEIVAARDPLPLQAAWAGLAGYDALMFVSGNAVDHFFGSKSPAARAGAA
jgi:uroporphyrinogen-III synthase